MKNKKLVIILLSLIVLIGGILFVNQIYNKPKNKHIPKRNNLAIMVKGESGEYISSDAIPKGNYILNEEKTICENNGKVLNYDSTLGKVSFSFVGSDRCSLYFDKIIDTEKPVISNLIVNDTTVTATLTDNIELSGYGISTSNSTEPTSWTTIGGKTYNLSLNVTSEGTYYLWVKDGAGNKEVSNAINISKKGWQTILANNGGKEVIEAKGDPDFSVVATTNEGMYAMEDDYTATTGMKSYYFRGAVDNNWVKFGKDLSGNDMYWRIIRINGDGSIRMIYTGITAPTESSKVVMTGTGTYIGGSAFNSSNNRAEYVGYVYTAGQQHGTSTDSTIKTYIDKWYTNTNLKNNILIIDSIFCNDRNVTSGTWSSMPSSDIYYASHTRYTGNKPTLICPSIEDKLTVNGYNNTIRSLIYPVGLITLDELILGGNVNFKNNNLSYLYTNSGYWTITPNSFPLTWGSVNYIFNLNGGLTQTSVYDQAGVRPVINLSANAKLSGDGTYNNVYTVS